jgi:predicted 2-oxoglutarate/Fe(II)-dependent dioxygenase YbiX
MGKLPIWPGNNGQEIDHVFRVLSLHHWLLNPQSRAELCRHIAAAPVEKAVVVGPAGEQFVDLESRRVDSSILPKEITAPLKRRLREILPEIEKHFTVRLANCEPPQYLSYHPGDFFKADRDIGGYEVKHSIGQRLVSVVIFLNGQSQEPAEGTYGEGQLVFTACWRVRSGKNVPSLWRLSRACSSRSLPINGTR